MKRGSAWIAPLTGIVFVALLVVSFAVAGEPPDAESASSEIVEHYVDNKDSIVAGALIGTIAAIFLIAFANYLRRTFAVAGDDRTAPVVLVGAAIVAVGGAIDSTIALATAEAAEDLEPASVQALQALWDNDFLPIALGAVIFMASVAAAILRTRILPAWLGWVAIALVVITFTPIGFVGFIGAGLWIIAASILLAVKARREEGTAGV